MTPNADLFVRVLAQIEREPKTWDQSTWANECGTAFCFAGWAIKFRDGWVRCSDGFWNIREPGTVSGFAAQLLGVDPALHSGDSGLFCALNNLADLYRISAEILGIDETVLRDKVAAEVADGAVQ